MHKETGVEMNKRIQELAEQARQIGEYVNYGQIRLSPGQFEQKFAELIIRECEKAILAEIAVPNITDEVEKVWEMGMECGVYTIKKHFGVE